MKIHRFLILFLASFILFSWVSSTSAWAAARGVISSKRANIRSGPTETSEVLMTLTKGTRVVVLRQKGKWLQIRVKLQDGFKFDGWVFYKLVKWSRAGSKATRQRRTSAQTQPRAQPRKQPKAEEDDFSDLEKFFETTEPTEGKSERTDRVKKRTVQREAEPKARFSQGPESGGPGFFGHLRDRARASVDVGYLLYNYKVLSGGTSVFSYNLPGFGFGVDLGYWFWQTSGGTFRTGANAGYRHGMYKFDTNLQAASGTTFQTVGSKASSNDIRLDLRGQYRFKPDARAARIEAFAGMEWFRFNADDVTNNAGQPLLLFVSQQLMSLLVGADAQIPIYGDFFGQLGMDLMVLNFGFSEDPAGATGTGPSAAIGYAPRVGFAWAPWERHLFNLTYALRMQKYTFSGAGTRVSNAITDGTSKSTIHTMGLRYDFLF